MILRVAVDRDGGREAEQTCRGIFPHQFDRSSLMNEPNEARDWCTERWGKRAGDIDIVREGPGHRAYAVIDTERSWVETGAWFGFKTADQAFEFKMRWHGQP